MQLRLQLPAQSSQAAAAVASSSKEDVKYSPSSAERSHIATTSSSSAGRVQIHPAFRNGQNGATHRRTSPPAPLLATLNSQGLEQTHPYFRPTLAGSNRSLPSFVRPASASTTQAHEFYTGSVTGSSASRLPGVQTYPTSPVEADSRNGSVDTNLTVPSAGTVSKEWENWRKWVGDRSWPHH